MLIKNINELLEHHVYYGQGYGKECMCCVATVGNDGHIWMKRDLSKNRHEEYYDPEGFSFIGAFADDLPEYVENMLVGGIENLKPRPKKYRTLTVKDIDKMIDDKRKYQDKGNKDQKQGYKKKDKKSSSLEKNKKKFGGAK